MDRVSRCALLSALLLGMCSCGGEYIEPYQHFEGYIDLSTLREAQRFANEVADRRGLTVSQRYSEPREGLRAPHNKPHLVIFVYYREKDHLWVLSMGNADGRLWLSFNDESEMPLTELDSFISEIKNGLEDRLGIEFCRTEPRRSVCVETKPPVMRYKAPFHPDMKKVFSERQEVLPAAFKALWDIAKGWPGLRARNFAGAVEQITSRSDAFEVIVFHRREANVHAKRVLELGNAKDGGVVVMNLYAGNGLSDEDVSRLASEAKNALETRFGTPFCRVNLATDLCDREHARLEEERAASLD